jgi:hypothetical protein
MTANSFKEDKGEEVELIASRNFMISHPLVLPSSSVV